MQGGDLRPIDDRVQDAAGTSPWISRGRAVAIVYAASMFISVMDTQIVNVALPTLSREFKVTTA